jgi:hypothetical protein
MLANLPERVRAKIDTTSGPVFEGTRCWVWTGAISSKGYGSCWHNGSARQAHLVVWEMLFGRLRGRKRELDHRCRNRPCSNPAHLEPVTRGENNRRSTCWHHLCPT